MKIKITCTKREFAAMLDRCLVNRTTRNREYCCACPLSMACGEEGYESGMVDMCEIEEER